MMMMMMVIGVCVRVCVGCVCDFFLVVGLLCPAKEEGDEEEEEGGQVVCFLGYDSCITLWVVTFFNLFFVLVSYDEEEGEWK